MEKLLKSLLCLYLVSSLAHSSDSTSTAMLVWSEQRSNKNFHLYFSQSQSRIWSKPKILNISATPGILPTIGKDGLENIWVAWTELDNDRPRIRFRNRSNGTWGMPEILKTITIEDIAPSLAVDDQHTPWLVWSGSSETDSDIYFSRWHEDGWDKPAMVNRDDQHPDILPKIEIRPNTPPAISWQGFNGDRYTQYRSVWLGNGWSTEKELSHDILQSTEVQKPTFTKSQIRALLPDFIHDTSQATLFSSEMDQRTVRLNRLFNE